MFTRKRRTELFIRYGHDEAFNFYKVHEEQTEIEMVSPPVDGVVMTKVRETAENSLFYLGEVTITETKMKVNGHFGLGVVHGNAELSESLAFIDACYKGELFIDELECLVSDLEVKEKEAIDAKTKKLMTTKVEFETMDE